MERRAQAHPGHYASQPEKAVVLGDRREIFPADRHPSSELKRACKERRPPALRAEVAGDCSYQLAARYADELMVVRRDLAVIDEEHLFYGTSIDDKLCRELRFTSAGSFA
jgi:hypothetical protein